MNLFRVFNNKYTFALKALTTAFILLLFSYVTLNSLYVIFYYSSLKVDISTKILYLILGVNQIFLKELFVSVLTVVWLKYLKAPETLSPHIEQSQIKTSNALLKFKNLSLKDKLKLARVPLILAFILILVVKVAPSISTPKIEYISPNNSGTEIPLDASIEIVFNQTMNINSVNKAFRIEPNIEGNIEWESNQKFIFTPSEKYERSKTYKVSFNGLYFSSKFIPSLSNSSFEFTTLGNPKIIAASPKTESLEPNTPITIIFDRAVIPLTTIDQKNQYESPLKIEPPIEGEGRWLGTTAYQFRPTEPYKKATRYTVTVFGGIKSQDGGTMESSYVWDFVSTLPRVESTAPQNSYFYANPSGDIRFYFNQEVNLESFKSKFIFRKSADYSNILSTQSVTGNYYKDRTDPKIVIFKPSTPLLRGTTYTAIVEQGLMGIEGNVGMEEPYQLSFTTVKLPNYLGSSPVDGEKQVKTFNQIILRFETPMNLDSVLQNLKITPTPDTKPFLYFYDSTSVEVNTYLQRSAKYTVTLLADAKDQYGTPLGKSYTFSFETAPFDPSVSIEPSNTYFALFNKEITPRIITQVTNVNKLTYKLYKLGLTDFTHLYRLRNDYTYMMANCGPTYNPACQNWQTYDTSKLELTNSWYEDLDANQNVPVNVVSKVTNSSKGNLKPGMYYLDIAAQNGAHDNIVLIVSGTALTAKVSPDQIFSWAVDQTTAEPVSDMDMEMIAMDGTSIAKGKTNKDGVWMQNTKIYDETPNSYYYSGQDSKYFLIGRKGDDYSILSTAWSNGIKGGDFGFEYYYYGNTSEKHKLYLTIDNPIYRPGSKIEYKGLVRKDSDGKFEAVKAGELVRVAVTDSNGGEIYSTNAPINSFGSFSGNFELGPTTTLGYYNITCSYSGSSYAQSFQVEEFRKPEFLININSNKNTYTNNETANININASYYFGAPLADTQIKWSIKRKDYVFNWNKDSTYDFSNDDTYSYRWWDYYGGYDEGQLVTEGTGTTDSKGDLLIKLPLNISDFNASQTFSVVAEIQDKNNQIVSGSKEVVVNKGEYYIGVKPSSYVNTAKTEAKVDLVTVNREGKEVKDKKVKVNIYKRTWETIREKNPDDGLFYYVSKAKDNLVDELETTTDENGRSQVTFTPDEGGIYRIVATSRDSYDNKIQSGAYVWVSGEGYSGQRENHDRIPLITDKVDYFVGEDISAFAATPYQKETKSLYTIERSNVLDYFVSDTGGNSEKVNFKVKDTYSPNVYIGVIAPKGGDNPKNPPEFKIGYTKVNVINKSNKLVLDVKTDKDSYNPRDKMKLNFSVKDLAGKPQKAELLIGVVDKSVWDLSNVSFPNIYDTFYKQRPLKTVTSNSLTISMDRINANTDLGSKGGSGGGGGGGFFETIRNLFLNTAYWNPTLVTDNSGNTSVEVSLPDNLTTWKIVVYANTQTGGFGQTSSETIVSKDIIVRPMLPRFLSNGDESQLGALVLNRTEENQTLELELKTEGLSVNGNKKVSVTLKGGEQKKILWDTITTSQDSVKVDLIATNRDGEVVDGVETTLPVYMYYTAETTATSGEVKDIRDETVLVPDNIVKELGGLDVSLSPQLGADGLNAINYMLNYQYRCGEQTASRLISSLAVREILTKGGLEKLGNISLSSLDTAINEELQRISKNQTLDGGWNWWVDSTTQSLSDPFITAYTYHGLLLAKSAGFSIPEDITNKASTFLNSYISYTKDTYALPYILYVLPNKSSLGSYASNLWNLRFNLDIEQKTYLVLAMKDIPGMGNKAYRLKEDIIGLVKKSNTLSHWENRSGSYFYFGDDTSATAAVLQMMTVMDKDSPLIQETVRYLLNARQDNIWGSTKTTTSVLEALNKYIVSKNGYSVDETINVDLNAENVLTQKLTSQDILNIINTNIPSTKLNLGDNVVRLTRNGTGNLYYNINFKYYLPYSEVKPVEQGFTVIREFIDNNGKKVDPSKLVEGSSLWIRLLVVTPESRRHVVLEDKLPAGFESVNESLKNTASINANKPVVDPATQGNYWNSWYFNHKEYRDNRTALFAEYLPAGVYEIMYQVRATTPGKYHYPPAEAYEMYAPDVLGHSNGGWMEVFKSN